jgi:hypothetical protein
MIRLTIEIQAVPFGGNEFGAGVKVASDGLIDPKRIPDAEGATLIGLGMAINKYMRERGCPQFNCLKGLVDV